MNLLFVAAEAAPYYRTGGLSDVVYGLAKELCVQGYDARIVVPLYRGGAQGPPMRKVATDLPVSLGAYSRNAAVWKTQASPTFYFLDQPFYFGREDIYGYADDYERFLFFTRGALEMLSSPEFRSAENDWFPDIIHGFDWVTGMMPGWLPKQRELDSRFNRTRFTLYVHNIRRLGTFGSRALAVAEQESGGIFPEIGETSDHINFLGRGLLFADRVVAVNPNYNPLDNPLPEPAHVLESILAERRGDGSLLGIASRIDTVEWNPAADSALNAPFSYDTLDARAGNKLALQKQLRFKQDPAVPLLGMVGRLIPENGFDLLHAVERSLAQLGELQLVILAEPGDADYQGQLARWEAGQDSRRPWIKTRFDFDDNLARLIYGGSDIFLLPAREFPSGIMQLIAMRYGAVPVVRNTGAIAKTVHGWTPGMSRRDFPKGMGVGFRFDEHSEPAFLNALQAALAAYRGDRLLWRQIQLHNMGQSWSWADPAGEYLRLFEQVLTQPPRLIRTGTPQILGRASRVLQSLQELGNLPDAGSTTEILGEAARLVRWALACDAVYFATRGSVAPLSAAEPEDAAVDGVWESDLNPSRRPEPPDKGLVSTLLEQGRSTSWRHLGDIDTEGLCRPIQGLEASELARREGWVAGWSVPVSAQGRLLAWIDALFTDGTADQSWVISSLAWLAGAFASRLDTLRAQRESEIVSSIGLDLMAATSTQDALERTCAGAVKLCPGSTAWGWPAWTDAPAAPAPPDWIAAAQPRIQEVMGTRKPAYDPEWNDAPRGVDERRPLRSLLVIPIAPRAAGQTIPLKGVILLASPRHAAFSREQEHLLAYHLAPQAFAAIEKAQHSDAEGRRRVAEVEQLVSSLVAGVEFKDLLERVMDKIGEVLKVQAGALYLLNESTAKLELEAAYGYQKKFVGLGVSYTVAETSGLTGWIAKNKEIVRCSSLEELHNHPGWKGHFNRQHSVPEPNAFLGIPLVVQEPGKEPLVVGVLKVEGRTEKAATQVFDDGDIHLAAMMAHVIATTVYNAQRAETSLRELSANLQGLSDAMAGSLDREALLNNIVEKIAAVLRLDAASLYLANDEGTELVIQAAAGYQKPLVASKVTYKWGEGVTGTIAATRRVIGARTLAELRAVGCASNGKHDALHVDGFKPESFYGVPLVVAGKTQAIGVLKVESLHQGVFSGQDKLLIGMMANVIAAVVYNVQQSERHLSDFRDNLKSLSAVLAGSRNRETLIEGIVERIAEVLRLDAASLYLANDDGTELVIAAAAGYQKPLVEKKAAYLWGQGVTGRIAKTGEAVATSSLAELRSMGGGASFGAWDHLHVSGSRPQSFFGLPLAVAGQPRAIGVLKVESFKPAYFTSQDKILIGMMANVIATVVYNAQQSESRLREFSISLEILSGVLAGSNMRTVIDNIVDKVADVLRVDAASLYLANDDFSLLVIAAAAGYQKPLVEKKATYVWGKGVTGRIAAEKRAYSAQSLEDLRRIGGDPRGAFDDLQGGQQPQSFYGLPLVVAGLPNAIGVLKVESTKQRFFSAEDKLLIGMMANVIATVIYNARQSEKHLAGILQHLGCLSAPIDASADLLRRLARDTDSGIIDQLARALAADLDRTPGKALPELRALFESGANREIYRRVAFWSGVGQVRWPCLLFDAILETHGALTNWGEVAAVGEPWSALAGSTRESPAFQENSGRIAAMLGSALNAALVETGKDHLDTWFASVLETRRLFGDDAPAIPILFQRQGELDETNRLLLLHFLGGELKHPYSIGVIVLWTQDVTAARILEIREKMTTHAVDFVVAGIADFLGILQSPEPGNAFRRLVLSQATTQSAFIVEGPVPDAMFFGRAKELAEILRYLGHERSCVLMGGRRSGKTSILWRLHRLMLPDNGFRSVFCGVGAVRTPDEFFQLSTQNMRPEIAAPMSANMPRTVHELLEAPPGDKPYVLLLDEVDKIVDLDRRHGWIISSRLRTAVNSGLRIVICGERTLLSAGQDNSTPLANLGTPLVLGPLEYHDVELLIGDPFSQLGIQLVDPQAICKCVFDFTSGHPNIVQRIGRSLVRGINQRKVKRVTVADVKAVIAEPAFQRDDFLEIYWEKASNLEKIVSLLMVQDPHARTLPAIVAALAEKCSLTLGADEVYEALIRLTKLRLILKQQPTGFEFAVEAFPRVATGTMAADDLLLVYTAKYRNERPGELAGEIL